MAERAILAFKGQRFDPAYLHREIKACEVFTSQAFLFYANKLNVVRRYSDGDIVVYNAGDIHFLR